MHCCWCCTDTTLRRPRKKLHVQKQPQRVSAPAAPKIKKPQQEPARRPSYRQLYQIRRTNGDIISQVYTPIMLYILSLEIVFLIRMFGSRVSLYYFAPSLRVFFFKGLRMKMFVELGVEGDRVVKKGVCFLRGACVY